MKIKRILVSQPEPTSAKSPYFEFAERNNVKVDFRPFIQVEGVSAKEYRQTRVNILDHTAVIFTSRTAIDHFFRICNELRITAPESLNISAFQKQLLFTCRNILFTVSEKSFMEMEVFPIWWKSSKNISMKIIWSRYRIFTSQRSRNCLKKPTCGILKLFFTKRLAVIFLI